jgi:replicative DNA helicase
MDINLSDKVPPHSIESEQAVLGALLLDWDSMSEVVTTLKPEKFYSLQNQLIYEALFKLFTKNIKGDTLSLINKLTEDGKLEQAGGTAYIASLTDKVLLALVSFFGTMVLNEAVTIGTKINPDIKRLKNRLNPLLNCEVVVTVTQK